MNSAYLLLGMAAIVGGGVFTTLRVVVKLAARWATLEQRVTDMAEDITGVKKVTDQLVWERGSHAVSPSTGRR